MNSTAQFKIEYGGPALENHDIDIRDLAPALLAITDLFNESNRVINGSSAKTIVKIKTPVKEGSVGVDLLVLHTWTNNMVDLFAGKNATAAVNLLTLIMGLIGFISWVKNRGIKSVEKKNSEESTVVLGDGESMVISPHILALFQNVNVRVNIEQVIKTPLDQEGIDQFKLINEDGKASQIIEKKDRGYFVSPAIAGVLIDEQEYEKTIQIISMSFEEGYKWRFSDGQSTFTAEILDDDFNSRVNSSNESFCKDDYLKVRIVSKQYNTSKGLKSETQIIKVIRHISSAQQIPLPYKKNKEEEKGQS